MTLWDLLRRIASHPGVAEALESAAACKTPMTVELRDAFKPAFVAALAARLDRAMVLVTADEARAREMARDVETWWDGGNVLSFPDPDQPAYSQMSIAHDILSRRAGALAELAAYSTRTQSGGGRPPVVIASVSALMRRLTPVAEFRRHFLRIAPEQELRQEDLISRLTLLGYTRNPLVEAPGEFAARGGIVDVFPPQSPRPIRLDFFGDEIETVRYFDAETQRSLGKCPEFMLSAASEVPIWLGPQIAGALEKLDLDSLRPEDRVTWRRHLEDLEGSHYFETAAFYTASTLQDASTLVDYCPDAFVIVDEPEAVAWSAAEYSREAEAVRARLVKDGEVPDGFGSPLFSPEETARVLDGALLRLTYRPSPEPMTSRRSLEGFESPPSYSGRLRLLMSDLAPGRSTARFTVLVSYQGKRLGQLLNEEGLGAAMLEHLDPAAGVGAVAVVRGTLSEGWTHAATGIQILSDAEIFGRKRVHQVRRFKRPPDRTFLSDLLPGDYVVHVEHGIGRFDGIVRLSEVGGDREYLLLEYAKGDKLYVPVDQLGRVQRFVGMGEYRPKLSRLGTAEWTRAKDRARRSARDIAAELLEIYAGRELAKGRAFGSDTVWQKELEDDFPYVETPDQSQAIMDVKADLEKASPMDRLVCGDVGYGKTEVAIRAAFKVASDGAQVAILVPTTVLAQQHFDTFKGRMQRFPLRIEMLSRFRSPEEQRKVVEGLADGSVDIVIGTHRLIQDDVRFKELGLLVIDEEQRFGVAAKEKLKQLRKEVDVLTLTATPIPRTLHMALIGVREASVIDSPPEDRLAVKTYVTGYDDEIVRRSILRELDRGGQVFFVHNRVQTIEAAAAKLRDLVPEARFVVAHGQMPSSMLESVMVDFAAGEFDVLVCSSIIENGMDLPNVNTMIVDECWMFGLAQLYQLRGRVGRSSNQAYAYFLYKSNRRLTEEAQKRLQAILEASELGAGFRLAMRDLEIRGAGDLLGAEQHGFANAVGFDLYCQMLADAVRQMRGGEPLRPPVKPTAVDLPLDAYLPDVYMGGYETKIREYQRLAQIATVKEAREAIEGLRDRFGEFPAPVENLAYVIAVKAKATELGATAVTSYGGELMVKLPKALAVDPRVLRRTLGPGARIGKIGVDWPGFEGDPEWKDRLMDFLDEMAGQGLTVDTAASV